MNHPFAPAESGVADHDAPSVAEMVGDDATSNPLGMTASETLALRPPAFAGEREFGTVPPAFRRPDVDSCGAGSPETLSAPAKSPRERIYDWAAPKTHSQAKPA
ncbi:MAG TPA: hypothetical protein VGE52_17220, partial [Pirellulales bacterium]